MAQKRKSISPKVRFEVFKRDSFTCQYCGKQAPDVVLEIDHMKPVSDGGDNSIINLITSCWDCNRGKSDRLISDKSIIIKQKEQLNQLNERREQMRMIVEWQDELLNLTSEEIILLIDHWYKLTGYTLTETGENIINVCLKKHGFKMTIESMSSSCKAYLKKNDDGVIDKDSAEKAFNMIPRIATVTKKQEDDPELKDLYYCRGILRNRLRYINDLQALAWLKEARNKDKCSIEELKEICCNVKNWTEFRTMMFRIMMEG